MPPFEYSAIDAGGRLRNGVLQSMDESHARVALARRRLAPLTVRRLGSETAPARFSLAGHRRLSGRALALFTRQLATIISVTPVDEALRTIASQSESPKVRAAIVTIHQGVTEGLRLADAMARAGGSFPPLYRAMVAAGEASGGLPQILERMATLLERQQDVRGKLVAALAYPAALLFVAIGVVLMLIAYVVPQVVDQFVSMGQRLPLLTSVVIAGSRLITEWGWLIAAVTASAALAFNHALRIPKFKRQTDQWILHLPILGRIVRDVYATNLARTLSTMLACGLPIMEGLRITASTVENTVLRAATIQMSATISEGGSLSAAMKKSGFFPPLMLNMASSGEASGRLSLMLDSASDYIDREFNTKISAALSLLEPAIIVAMGGVVALIVLSIMLPILQINTSVLG